MKTVSLVKVTALLSTLAAAAPADLPDHVLKVGSRPGVELYSKRDLIANPKAQRAPWSQRTVARMPWGQLTSSIAAASSSSALVAAAAASSSSRTTTTTPLRTTTTTRAATTTTARTTTTVPSTPVATSTRIATQSSPQPVTATIATPVAAPSSTLGADIRAAVLNEHNTFRAQHAAPPLVWDQSLADAAASWANHCVFQHSQGALGPYGENLAASAGSGVNVQTALSGVAAWEAEAPQYDPSNPVYSHFTQMVWKGTTKIGCYQALCAPGSIFDARYGDASFLVCEYNPPGNVYPASNFLINVTP